MQYSHSGRFADEMKAGDTLIFYVSSGMSQFADVREVTKEGTFKLGVGGRYDTAFPIFIATKPVLTLERRMPGQQVVGDGSERIDIAPPVELTLAPFWRASMLGDNSALSILQIPNDQNAVPFQDRIFP